MMSLDVYQVLLAIPLCFIVFAFCYLYRKKIFNLCDVLRIFHCLVRARKVCKDKLFEIRVIHGSEDLRYEAVPMKDETLRVANSVAADPAKDDNASVKSDLKPERKPPCPPPKDMERIRSILQEPVAVNIKIPEVIHWNNPIDPDEPPAVPFKSPEVAVKIKRKSKEIGRSGRRRKRNSAQTPLPALPSTVAGDRNQEAKNHRWKRRRFLSETASDRNCKKELPRLNSFQMTDFSDRPRLPRKTRNADVFMGTSGNSSSDVDSRGFYFKFKSIDVPECKEIVAKFEKKKMYFSKERISNTKEIGAGSFGSVLKATLAVTNTESRVIAVKTLKGFKNAKPGPIYGPLLKEALTMMELHHENVLSLYGISIDEIGTPMLLMPFMELGDLKKFLPHIENKLNMTDLLNFIEQIAKGMVYLSEMQFVHRDLAARNCMLTREKGYLQVKVADFGLTRTLLRKDYYKMTITENSKVPFKWMALECFQTGQFTVASDVWSYGVVLWEIMTFGATPYFSIPNTELESYLKDNHRLTIPQNCPEKLSDLMMSCWNADRHRRPTFTEILNEVRKVQCTIAQCPEVSAEDDDDSETCLYDTRKQCDSEYSQNIDWNSRTKTL